MLKKTGRLTDFLDSGSPLKESIRYAAEVEPTQMQGAGTNCVKSLSRRQSKDRVSQSLASAVLISSVPECSRPVCTAKC